MNVGEDTVKKHLLRAMRRLGLERRTQLAVSWTTGRPLDIAAPALQAGRPRKESRSRERNPGP